MRAREADDLECFERDNSQSSLRLVIRGTKYVRLGRPCFRRRTNPALEWAFLGSGAAFYDQPARGSLRKRATSSASPLEVTAAAPEHVGACRAGMVPAARREPFNVA
jgi:hypothetical protein